MAMVNMNLIGVFVTKLWPVQALACGGGDGGDSGGTKTITGFIPEIHKKVPRHLPDITPKFPDKFIYI